MISRSVLLRKRRVLDNFLEQIKTHNLSEVIALCYLNIYFITIRFRQHNNI